MRQWPSSVRRRFLKQPVVANLETNSRFLYVHSMDSLTVIKHTRRDFGKLAVPELLQPNDNPDSRKLAPKPRTSGLLLDRAKTPTSRVHSLAHFCHVLRVTIC